MVDLDRFERLSRSPDRSELQAAALYRGEFPADFDIDSYRGNPRTRLGPGTPGVARQGGHIGEVWDLV